MNKQIHEMTVGELEAELTRLKDNLCDLEDVHSFTFGKTSVHIGAEQAQNMAVEHDEECRRYNERIAAVERLLAEKQRP